MDQPGLVQSLDGSADLAGAGERLGLLQRALLFNQILERPPRQVLHHDVAGGVLGKNTVHLHDAGMRRVRHLLPDVEETLLFEGELRCLPIRRGAHREAVAIAAFGKEFLDCNRCVFPSALVGDPEIVCLNREKAVLFQNQVH